MRRVLNLIGDILIDITGFAIAVGFIAVAAYIMATRG